MKIAFMGTPQFAVPTLKAIHASSHELCVIVTGADKPKGRSGKPVYTPVKNVALGLDIPVLQPENLHHESFERDFRKFNPDICMVVAFRILPENIVDVPNSGCVNLHPSLLPDLRGAAPLNWALIRGYTRTGITTFKLVKKVDSGSILLQDEVEIDPSDDVGSLSARLSELGANLVVKTLDLADQNKLFPRQQVGKVTQAPKITDEICKVDWDRQAVEIHNLVRGLSPKPGAYSTLTGKKLKLFKTFVIDDDSVGESGRIVSGSDDKLNVQCGKGILTVTEIQIEGRRRMTSKEFLRGKRIPAGTLLG